jgi:hypothetical protein
VPEQQAPKDITTSAFVEAFGGVRGLVDSALPATVFVLVRLITHSLSDAVYAAVAVGLAVLVLRRVRGQSLQQAASGFLGLAVAVVVARATGSGEGFFLPGIITTALTGVAFVVSLLLRRPAVGLALGAFDPAYAAWQEHPPLVRAVRLATAFWALTFFVRAGVAFAVYTRAGDNDGALLLVINAVKWPLIAAAALLTVTLVKKAGHPPAVPSAEPVQP